MNKRLWTHDCVACRHHKQQRHCVYSKQAKEKRKGASTHRAESRQMRGGSPHKNYGHSCKQRHKHTQTLAFHTHTPTLTFTHTAHKNTQAHKHTAHKHTKTRRHTHRSSLLRCDQFCKVLWWQNACGANARGEHDAVLAHKERNVVCEALCEVNVHECIARRSHAAAHP